MAGNKSSRRSKDLWKNLENQEMTFMLNIVSCDPRFVFLALREKSRFSTPLVKNTVNEGICTIVSNLGTKDTGLQRDRGT